MMRRLVMATALAVVLAALGGGPALATDQPLAGSKLVVLDLRRLSLVSVTSLTAPTPGGSDDPTRVGGSLMIYNPTSGESATFDMPASNWRVSSSGSSFKFANRNAPAPPSEVRVVRLRNGRLLKVSAKASGLQLDEPSQGSLGVVLTTGSQRYCFLFGGTVTLDQPGTFAARTAPAPASCPPASGATTSTTVALTTTSSTTTQPPTATTTSTTTATAATSTTTSSTLPPTTTTSTTLAPAVLSIAPTSHDFGSVAIGATSVPQTFIVTNTGGSPTGLLSAVTFTGANAAEFRYFDNVCTGRVLAAGATCSVAVEFIPNATGAAAAQVQVSASPGGTATAALSGSGLAAAALSITPLSHDFGSVPVGATSAQTFTVVNTGGSPTGPLSAVTFTGTNAAEFAGAYNFCTGAVLPAGFYCSFDVEFIPNATGAAAAQVLIGASPGGSAIAALSGTGLAAAALAIVPTSHDFGSVVKGATSASQTFAVTNVGGSLTGPLSVTFTGANAVEFVYFNNFCTGTALAPGATCSVAVEFVPNATGAALAQLQISASPGGTATATVSGTGTAPTTTTTSSTTTSTTTTSTTTTTVPPTTTTTSSTTTTTQPPTTTTTSSSTTTTTVPPTTTTTSTTTTTTTLAPTCNPTGASCTVNTDCCSGICLSTQTCQ